MSTGKPLSKVIISGGGTGGHIFPAIAVANEIRRRNPEAQILFVGAEGRMEMEKVPAAGYQIVGLPVRGIQRSLSLKNLSVPFKAIKSLMMARKLIGQFQPEAAAGFGGYASGPMMLACKMKGVPYIIQEQNSYAGVTNKLLASGAARVCTAWPDMEKYFPQDKIILTGNPVREGFSDIADRRAEAMAHFGLVPGRPVLLVTGGSLGAGSINMAIGEGYNRILNEGYQLIWQTGKHFSYQAERLAQSWRGKGLWTSPFIDRMDLAYAASDVVVSRAGALTISELCLVAKPALLVPSPNVAEDHQTKNARALTDRGAAALVADHEAEKKLVEEAIFLLKDPVRRQDYSEKIAKLALPNATALIVDALEQAVTFQQK